MRIKSLNKNNKIKSAVFLKGFSQYKKINNKGLRYYFTIHNLKFKIKQIRDGYILLQEALNEFDKNNNLKFFERLSTVLFFAGFCSFSLCLLEISLIFTPFVLALISIIEYILGLFLVVYVTIRRLHFIYFFDLDCNPCFIVKFITGELIAGKALFKGFAYFCGGMVSTNYVVDEVTGVSIFREYGKNYVYGDQTFTEATKSVYSKLFKENNDRFID